MIVAEKTYRTFSSQNYRWVLPEVRWSESCSVMFDSLQLQGLYSPWNSPGQKTGVGSLSILQGIFPTQGLNPGLPHCRQILSQLSHKGSPRILEWVAYPFSRGSSQPRNRTQVSRTAGGFFTIWATREAQEYWNGWPTPPPGDIPDPGMEPASPTLQADSLPAELPYMHMYIYSFSNYFPL